MNRYLLILITLILQTWVVQADDAEREMFIEKGFNWKHYEKAQRLNLDLENYTIFNSNKSNKIRGAVMLGVGGGTCGIGLYFIFLGALVSSVDNSYDDYYNYGYSGDDEVDAIKGFFLVTGGIFCATGAGLIIGGAVKRTQIGKVFTKSGTRLSLKPKLDAINDRYGMQLSLSF